MSENDLPFFVGSVQKSDIDHRLTIITTAVDWKRCRPTEFDTQVVSCSGIRIGLDFALRAPCDGP